MPASHILAQRISAPTRTLLKTGTRPFFSNLVKDGKKKKPTTKNGGSSPRGASSDASVKRQNRTDLARMISEDFELPFKKSDRIVKLIFDSMAESLIKKERVFIAGFGTFDNVVAKSRNSYNIATGETVLLPDRQRVKFTISKTLKDSLNEK